MFVDRVKIHVKGGDGGDGKVSFYRAKYITHGGPDGGDGGKGGNVIFVGESGMNTLMDFRYKRKFAATPGEPGGKRNCFGKDGEDVIIKVPVGTVIREAESGKVMADITKPNEEKILIYGGKGGKGKDCQGNNRDSLPYRRGKGSGLSDRQTLRRRLRQDFHRLLHRRRHRRGHCPYAPDRGSRHGRQGFGRHPGLRQGKGHGRSRRHPHRRLCRHCHRGSRAG